MFNEPKFHNKLKIPNQSAWDKKSYDPIVWLYRSREEHHIILEEYFFNPYFDFKYLIKNIFSFFRKLFVWVPVLWRDRDYDDFYIFEILKTKILQQRKYLVQNNRHTNIENDNFWMTVCLNLIERIQTSYYEMEYFQYEESDIYFVETEEDKNLFEMKQTFNIDNRLNYINKYPLDRKKAIALIKNLRNQDISDYTENSESKGTLCLFMASLRHKKAINLLFSILNNKIEHWWD